jgi:hypothetical protein
LVLPAIYLRTRRKGYRPFGAGLTVVAGLCAATGLAIVAGSIKDWSAVEFVTLYLVFVLGPLLVWVGVSALLFLALPRRYNRVFGPRHIRFPFIALGWVVIGIGMVCALSLSLTWPVTGKHLKDYATPVIAGIALFAVFVRLGQPLILRGRFLANQQTLEAALASDPRPPILYVRPFELDQKLFVIGDKDTYGRYQTKFLDSSKIQKAFIRFEDYIGRSIKERIGPFVALGSPEDSVAPAGAARRYAKDGRWKEEFNQLLHTAAGVLVEVAVSDNVKWEFEQIREQGCHTRLFVITPHPTSSRVPPRGWGWLARLTVRMSLAVSQTNWNQFVAILVPLGYHLDLEDPGPGCVVTFEPGRPCNRLDARRRPATRIRRAHPRAPAESHVSYDRSD